LLKVFTGSRKAPSLTLSHHLEASPMNANDSVDCINCRALKI
jgi:hypothetical protein